MLKSPIFMNLPSEKQDSREMKAMFGAIAPRYDFVTRIFSYGMDGKWKRTGVKESALPEDAVVLDLAAGTGDFSKLVLERLPRSRAIAVDLTEPMLRVACENGVREAVCGDAGALPFRDASFDCVFVGYGLKFPEPESGATRDRTSDAAGRANREPRFFSSCQCRFSAVLFGVSLFAGRVLGAITARACADIYIYSRFVAQFSFHGEVLYDARTDRLRTDPGAIFYSRRHRVALRREARNADSAGALTRLRLRH